MELYSEIFTLVSQLGPAAYWLIFLVSFLESLAFIGTLFPGSSLIIFAGFLSSQGNLDPGSLITFTILGGFLGDNFSFWLGNKKFFINKKLYQHKYLEKGYCFFKKYKAESIFLARFIGPTRSVIPFVAGSASLNYRTFFLWNFSSIILWAISHVLLGHFFGASLYLLAPWIKKGKFLLLFTIGFFSFFYFGKKFLFYRKQKQFSTKNCSK